ncbi:VCBS repeat-containing protein [Flavobacteriaceae bacterium]|nr:VCBS repeat-containing protein [Flavobacteriaceae bacterium]MDB2413751.1 VCBS repeat-containing protein [Flavobacteriaceae bacterium]
MREFIAYCLLLSLISCTNNNSLFVSLKKNKTQINFQNNLTSTADLNILNYLYYYNGAGVAAADFNNDGLADLYFTGNQTEDKLFLNLGELQFKDISTEAHINNPFPWTTGVTTVDINNDGFLDIYICKVGKHNSIKGKNLLYLNQGLDKNGIPVFKESASLFGLDIVSLATQATFFDYDKDGDLDLFLMNHSLYPNSNYGKGGIRRQVDEMSGDKLYENKQGTYVDVSTQSGIFQGKIGYGLGVSIGDVTNDGYPDIYVGNDFFENDYLYINQKDKTFSEVISKDKTNLGHTSHYSMGNAIADLNNDSQLDIVSLDMLPENLTTYKTSGLEFPYQTYQYYLKNGYAPQFMQNTLHYNNGNGTFSETAYLSGIAATEWSWSPIVADYDNDGFKDLYITNGILGATNDMDYINFISNEKIQKQLATEKSQRNLELSKQIPQKKVKNYFYKNNQDKTFKNVTSTWVSHGNSYSNGGTSVDLDNDGDLDLVINNINEDAFVLENTSDQNSQNSYLKIKFKGNSTNIFGIGTTVKAYYQNKVIVEENYTTKGYLSSVEPKIHLGLGDAKVIDSLEVIWSTNAHETLRDIKPNQEIVVYYENALKNYSYEVLGKQSSFFVNKDSIIDFKHKDSQSLEFNRDQIIPYASSNLGPHIAVSDINNDGLEDFFIGGGKSQSSQLFIQNKKGKFTSEQSDVFRNDAIHEDVYAVLFDANGDSFNDLLVVSGGNEFKKGTPLQPKLYINNKGKFKRDLIQFKKIETNASKVSAIDIDNDGDMDISILSNIVPWQFGKTPTQYIFENDGQGNFKDVTLKFGIDFKESGNVTDIVWIDLNEDNFLDAIVVGYWMPIKVFMNDGKKLTLQKNTQLQKTNGWWNSIKANDFDKDGDIDFIVGNWGLNTRLKATSDEPITLYSNDFDDNGTIDPVITYFYQKQETPFASKDELVKQIPFLNKKFLSYKDFAEASFTELLPKDKINGAFKKQVFELGSSYFENQGDNTFKKHQLPFMAQISSVNDIAVDDFNNDGYTDVLLVGNNYNINTQLGKLDASHGLILLNNKKGFFYESLDQDFDISGEARNIDKLSINNEMFYVISINKDVPIFIKLHK